MTKTLSRVVAGIVLAGLVGGCSKDETLIRIHNEGPTELAQVVLLIGGQPTELGTLAVGEEARLRVPPIRGATLEVRFIGLPEDEHPLIIKGALPDDEYGEVILGIKNRRFSERLIGHQR